MTTFFLIRHGTNDFLGRGIAGRKSGVCLNDEGRLQSERLAERLQRESVRHIFSSPIQRCQETAAPLAKRLGLKPQISEALNEVDFGDWTGRSLDDLRLLEGWKIWTSFRSACRIPNGESIVEVQARMAGELQRLHKLFPDDAIAVFSHGDPIRSVLCYFLGIPLDYLTRMEVDPASVNILTLNENEPRVLRINEGP
jgi:probable phosphomutase (TIGR03848 family)